MKSDKWLIIRDKGVEVVCPMITKVHWEPTEHTKSITDTTNRQTDNKHKVATDKALNLTCRMFTSSPA